MQLTYSVGRRDEARQGWRETQGQSGGQAMKVEEEDWGGKRDDKRRRGKEERLQGSVAA